MHHTAYKLQRKLPDEFHWTLPSTLWSTLPIALGCTLPACFTILPQLLSMALSKPTWLYTLKYALKMFSSILQSTLSNTLPIALNDTPSLLEYTLPSKLSRQSQEHLQVHTQVDLRVGLKYTSESLWSTFLSSCSSTLLTALDDKLPAYLALCSQIESPEARHSQSHLTICSHVCSCMFGPETCWAAGARHQ